MGLKEKITIPLVIRNKKQTTTKTKRTNNCRLYQNKNIWQMIGFYLYLLDVLAFMEQILQE